VDKDHSLLTTAFQQNKTAMSIHNELTSGSATASRPLLDHEHRKIKMY